MNRLAMLNHPNRSRRADNPAANPTPDQIRAAREAAGLTQSQAAALVCSTLPRWQEWEYGKHRMHPGLWRLFRATLAHPEIFDALDDQ